MPEAVAGEAIGSAVVEIMTGRCCATTQSAYSAFRLSRLIAGNVGYISPADHYIPFLFMESTAIDEIAKELRSTVATYGLPFMKMNADLATLVETMQTARFGIPFVIEYRIPTRRYCARGEGGGHDFSSARTGHIGDARGRRHTGLNAGGFNVR